MTRTLHEELFSPERFQRALRLRIAHQTKEELVGSAPNFLLGSYGYPTVNLGLLATGSYKDHDQQSAWVKKGYNLKKIVGLRSELYSGIRSIQIGGQKQDRLLAIAQEVAMSAKPASVDLKFVEKPRFRLHFYDQNTPHGPQALLQSALITQNPRVPRVVDKVVADTDLKASLGFQTLRKKGIDHQHMVKLLSAGLLGTQAKRKLVPTKWSITAIDDSIGRDLRNKISYQETTPYEARWGSYQGNHFLILFLPQPWSFELFERYTGTKNKGLAGWYTDFESPRGRTSYAKQTAGGYYAARVSILNHLEQRGLQAGVLVIRFITDDYWAPLGVWVVREAVAQILNNPATVCDSLEEILKQMDAWMGRFGVAGVEIRRISTLLRELSSQRRLSSYQTKM